MSKPLDVSIMSEDVLSSINKIINIQNVEKDSLPPSQTYGKYTS